MTSFEANAYHPAMTRRESIVLPSMSLGTQRSLEVRRYGAPGSRPKAYLQASLHADEIPAMLVLNHLSERLEQATRADQVRGEVVVVPPIPSDIRSSSRDAAWGASPSQAAAISIVISRTSPRRSRRPSAIA